MAQNNVVVGGTEAEREVLLQGVGCYSNESEKIAIASPDVPAAVVVSKVEQPAYGSGVTISDINRNRITEESEE